MKQYTLINRVLAGVSFLVALITYTLTLQPSVPFWDCGEFSAATAWQQVPHPPGAPLFLIVARWFHMIPIGDPGWRINMVSAVSSAFTAAVVYLIVVKMIERWRPFREGHSPMSYIPTFGGAIIGALSFTWCDTQWFNSVESEVYAAGTLLIAILIWLMMRWNEVAEKRGHERYLLMMAYVVGLAFGVHLLALLVVPAIAMVIYFRRYKFTPWSFTVMLGITGIVFFFLVYKAPLQYIPKFTAINPIYGIMIVAALLGVLWWSVRERKTVVYLSTASFLLILLGFSTYAHILMRANAHPAMNENEPDTVSELVGYLGREQYGNRGSWPRRQETESYYRQYQDKYGEWFEPVGRNDDGTYQYDQINVAGEVNFLLKYQCGHMYFRYLLWNFYGRVSDVQDAEAAGFSVNAQEKAQFITPTGYPDVFPIRFFALPFLLGLIGMFYHFKRDWKMALAYMTLFLLLGIVATLQQNQQQPQPRERDYFYVGSFMVFAMWIGIGVTGIAEQLGRPKLVESEEEDGELHEQGVGRVGLMAAIMAVGFVMAPLNMAVGGWRAHDRSKNWVPWDYAYNILQSCEKDAILFCNGDNDTFPLWYMQDVAGVRQDIRVVNLSLGQTPWYIWQLKNERPWNAKQVPISFSNEMLKKGEDEEGGLRPEIAHEAQTVVIDVPADVMSWATNGKNTQAGKMNWKMRGGDYPGQAQGTFMGVQHKLVRDIMETNHWKRPVYFSSSTQSDVWSGLENYFRTEGMAYRIMPVQQPQNSINLDVMRKCLLGVIPGNDFKTDPNYGFKFRYLNDKSAFFMDDHRRLVVTYRLLYDRLAQYELTEGKNPKGAIAALDKLEQEIDPDMFNMPYQISQEIARIYKEAGAPEKAAKYAKLTLKSLDEQKDIDESGGTSRYSGSPAEVLAARAAMYELMGDYDRAKKEYQSQDQSNPNVRGQIELIDLQQFLDKKDTAGAINQLKKTIAGYGKDSGNVAMQRNAEVFRQRLSELMKTPIDNTSVSDSTVGSSAHGN